MIYVLDTSAFSALMRGEQRIVSWLSLINSSDQIVVCAITRGEILFGIERLAAGRRKTDLAEKALNLFAALPCVEVTAAAGDVYARLKSSQQRRGLPLDENDLWIASTALALNAALVSDDSDFQYVDELTVIRP